MKMNILKFQPKSQEECWSLWSFLLEIRKIISNQTIIWWDEKTSHESTTRLSISHFFFRTKLCLQPQHSLREDISDTLQLQLLCPSLYVCTITVWIFTWLSAIIPFVYSFVTAPTYMPISLCLYHYRLDIHIYL